jgi:hypothetical protein
VLPFEREPNSCHGRPATRLFDEGESLVVSLAARFHDKRSQPFDFQEDFLGRDQVKPGRKDRGFQNGMVRPIESEKRPA